MEALYLYIAKSAGLLLLFYGAYYFLLRKETFFSSNRWFLISGLIISAVLPFLSFKRIVWIDAEPLTNINITQQNSVQNINATDSVNYGLYIILIIYIIGLLVHFIKFALDFYNLQLVLKGKKIQQQADFKFIDTSENIAPFSYFEYIVYNSSMYTELELENIIEHEKVHSDQNHTIDVLIMRLFSVIFWFNPIIWLYKKAVTQNLEFIADKEAAEKISDKKAYQYTLLKITTQESCVAITNHFYQSLIKKRIVMLNKNQSKKRNYWKYYTVVPVLAGFIFLFQIEVIAKEKPQIVQENDSNIQSVDVYKIRKNTTDTELEEIKENLKKLHNIKFEISEIKRNASNQLTSLVVDIKKGSQRAKSVQSSDDETINEFGVVVITYKNGDKKIGIQTIDEKQNKDPKTAVSNKLKQKQNSHVDTNINVSTKTNTHTTTNTSTVVTSHDNNTTNTITVGDASTVVVSNGAKSNMKQGFQLLIIDGKEMPKDFNLEDLPSKNIKSMSVYTGTDALNKYGDRGGNGVIEIETRK
ncbi:M56 family metallopeptidase [Flavobacterium gelatinilyticum]|uniref:M56 family metallopeptidase n=1 Tax=Flavobacterium gelatinilyticum TaxID=3003260 RepID=UPI002480D6C5|nr:M56 family metallopeptidase [Flavobacterium gelatinilyticum]